MIKPTDAQLILLSTAAQRDSGSLIPVPDQIIAPAPQVSKAIASLIKSGLAEEGELQDAVLAWRTNDKINYGARITDAGRTALGLTDTPIDAPVSSMENQVAPKRKKHTKTVLVLEMLQRDQGATLDELVSATGWFPHTTRAALTGLRNKHHEIVKTKRDGRPATA